MHTNIAIVFNNVKHSIIPKHAYNATMMEFVWCFSILKKKNSF